MKRTEASSIPDAAPDRPADGTPMLRQYHEIKQRHPGHVLFYRMGDFYEMFFEDARIAHEVLGLTLTSRGQQGGGSAPDGVQLHPQPPPPTPAPPWAVSLLK